MKQQHMDDYFLQGKHITSRVCEVHNKKLCMRHFTLCHCIFSDEQWRDEELCAPSARKEEEEEEECGRKEEDHLTDDKELEEKEEMEEDAHCCFSGDDGVDPGEARGGV